MGSAANLGDAILGGEEIPSDFFYGPARYLTAPQVKEIVAALSLITEDALRSTFDPEALNAAEVPPEGGWRRDDFPHLWQTLTEIRDFFQGAAQDGDAMLLHLA